MAPDGEIPAGVKKLDIVKSDIAPVTRLSTALTIPKAMVFPPIASYGLWVQIKVRNNGLRQKKFNEIQVFFITN